MDHFCSTNPIAAADEKVGHDFSGHGLGLLCASGSHLYSGDPEEELALGLRDVDESHLFVHRSLPYLSLSAMARWTVNYMGGAVRQMPSRPLDF